MTIQDNQLLPFMIAIPTLFMKDETSKDFEIEKFGFFLSFTVKKSEEIEEDSGTAYASPSGKVVNTDYEIEDLSLYFDDEEIQLTKEQENTLYTDLIHSIL
jgi:hypothetical protein